MAGWPTKKTISPGNLADLGQIRRTVLTIPADLTSGLYISTNVIMRARTCARNRFKKILNIEIRQTFGQDYFHIFDRFRAKICARIVTSGRFRAKLKHLPEIGRISAYFHQLLCKTSKIFAQFRAYFCIKVWQIWRNPSKINIPIGKFDRNQSKINIPIAHFFAVLWIWPSGKFQNFIFLQIRDLCQICVHLPSRLRGWCH